jgi:phage shock protein PspC (stress-responsive transcriptional regulator)
MNWKKFKLGKGGVFGVCSGLSVSTGIPVGLFRILAFFLMFKGLFVYYWYSLIVLFVCSVISESKKKIKKDKSKSEYCDIFKIKMKKKVKNEKMGFEDFKKDFKKDLEKK